jgi:uncharacterized protein YndB with AHSA1/START domain
MASVSPNPSPSSAAKAPSAGFPPIIVVRRLKAPRALVFKMFTDAVHLARWFGPEGHTCTGCTVEPKIGGRFFSALKGPDGIERRVQGVFTEIEPDRSVAFTWGWLDESGKPRYPDLRTVVTITLAEKNGETELTLVHTGFENAEQAGMHDKGWISSLVCLDHYLTTTAF